MWNKIKTVLAVIGACISSVCIALFLKGRSDRRGSEGNDEQDRRIQEGIDRAERDIAEADRITGELSGTIEERTRKCEEHLSRAEEILREAVKRREKEKDSSLGDGRN